MISAIIKPFKLEQVREALAQAGVTGITICEAKGYGNQKPRSFVHGRHDNLVDFVPKVEIEFVIDAQLLPAAIDAINRAARTGKSGDGKIVVSDIEDTVRIRTGETGALAVA
jgi:nitrogen regulatory protein P-II 1